MSGDNFTLANVTSDGDFKITINDGGATKTPIAITGSTGDIRLTGNTAIDGNLEVTGTTTIVNTTTLSVEDNIIELNRNISGNAGMPQHSGLKVNRGESSTATEQDLYWVWDETFADDTTTTFGNAGGAWTAFKSGGGEEMSAPTLVDLRANIVHATSTGAQYADLAERYAADVPLQVGDVVELGGSKEVTRCNEVKSNKILINPFS